MQQESAIPLPALVTPDVAPAKPQWNAPLAQFHGVEVTRAALPGLGADGVAGLCAS